MSEYSMPLAAARRQCLLLSKVLIKAICARKDAAPVELTVEQIADLRSSREFMLSTIAGDLRVTFYPGQACSKRRYLPCWIACRFMDVDRARTTINGGSRLNRYSGKWNFMFGVNISDYELTDLVNQFAKLEVSDIRFTGPGLIERAAACTT